MDATDPKPIAVPKPPQPVTVPWNPLIGILLVGIVYVAAQVIGGLLLAIYPALHHWSSPHTKDWLTNSTIAQFWFTLLFEAQTLGAIYLFLRAYKRTLAVIGLSHAKWRDIGFGLLAFSVYFVGFAVLITVLSHLIPSLNVDQKQEIGFDNVSGNLALILTFVSLVILPPIVEEIAFRGFIYTGLRKWVNFYWAALITSVLFALPHLAEGGAAGPLYVGGIDTLVLSLVLCFVREKTNRLWAGILVHMLKNLLAFTSLYLIGGK